MDEQLISFKTAKLAKKSGFSLDWCMEGYTKKGEFILYSKRYLSQNWEKDCKTRIKILEETKNDLPRPRQSLLQKWLREEHNLFLTICFDINTMNTYLYYKIDSRCGSIKTEFKHIFTTYEEALEEGLYKALKLIKKNDIKTNYSSS